LEPQLSYLTIANLPSDNTSKGGSNHSSLGWNLGQTSSEEVDVLDVILVGASERFDRARTHDVIEVGPGLDLRQATELPPVGVAREAVVATSLNDLRNEIKSEACWKYFREKIKTFKNLLIMILQLD
jgi:hypothetical protein